MRWFESSYPSSACRRGGIGRRAGLKIQCPHGRAGSTPAAGIVEKTRFRNLVFSFFQYLSLKLLKISSLFLGMVILGNEKEKRFYPSSL